MLYRSTKNEERCEITIWVNEIKGSSILILDLSRSETATNKNSLAYTELVIKDSLRK